MPRPAEQEAKRTEGLWERLSILERILIPLTLLAIIFVIVLLFLFAKKEVDFALKYCNTSTCLSEASKIIAYVDPEINPCDDFYQFACGNFLQNAHGDEKLALPQVLQYQGKRELFEAYIEPIQDSDHKMVKAAKKLFRGCMNETEIEMDNLHTIQEAVKAVAGWPVVEGSKWKTGIFDWVTASYKLRELGYQYSVFLDLMIVNDPEDTTKHIFKVAIPDMWDNSYYTNSEFMTEVAILFGAQNTSKTSGEIAKAHEFLTRLQLEIHNQYAIGTETKFTVKEYQQKCKTLNWHEFINKIASPPAEISEDDYVLFPTPETLTSWIDLISRTPKRTQANYMMWKVIEAALPYLTEDIRNRQSNHRRREERKEFCLREIQEKFIYSPIDIMCDRKYLTKKKRGKVEEISDNIKSELIDALENIQWMNKTDKEEVLDKAKAIKIVVGQPGNYFDDNILDDLDVDMVPTKNNTFLSLIAQAKRNLQTTIYQQINKLTKDSSFPKWNFKFNPHYPSYSEEEDIIYIPAVSVSNFLFDETRPNYVNYGALGVQVGQEISGVLNRYIRHEKQEKRKCMEEAMEDFKLNLDRYQIDNIIRGSIGERLSYTAYEKWVSKHGEEQHLITIAYSPRQLFWISAAFTYCQPIGFSMQTEYFNKIFSNMVSGFMRNNDQLAKIFECPEGTKMNPSKRCSLL